MKIRTKLGLDIEFLNFNQLEIHGFFLAAKAAMDTLFAGVQTMPTKSKVVYILRNPYDHPRYLTETPFEMITVNAGENKPFQFMYQFAHEIGHLSSQSSSRWNKVGRHQWIEESLCGAFSIYCLRAAATSGDLVWFRNGAQEYLTTYVEKAYPVGSQLGSDWFTANVSTLKRLNSLDDIIKPISRLIADEFSNGEFVLDNIALGETTLNTNVDEYLDEWSKRCSLQKNVPNLLKERFAT